MSKEMSLSRSIKKQADNYLESIGFGNSELVVRGVKIDFPYSEVACASYDSYVPAGVFKSYEEMSELFNPERIPPKWINFIKEVDKERRNNGCDGPIDLGSGLYFLTEESALARKSGLPKLGRLDEGGIDFQDGKKIEKMINQVLDDPKLRSEYKAILCCLMPDVSHGWLDEDSIGKVLQKLGVKKGILLDLGCGTGEKTEIWSEKLGILTVGVERQYHEHWYGPYWRDGIRKKNNLAFVRGDFKRGLPIKDECADAAIFQFVAQHITEESMECGLQEASRVLKNGGLLFVGPQCSQGHSGWRIFRKESQNGKDESSFKEYKYYDIIPEDKPKPWRWKRIK